MSASVLEIPPSFGEVRSLDPNAYTQRVVESSEEDRASLPAEILYLIFCSDDCDLQELAMESLLVG